MLLLGKGLRPLPRPRLRSASQVTVEFWFTAAIVNFERCMAVFTAAIDLSEIYRLAGDSLGLSTFTYTQRAPEEAAFVSCALRSFNVMQGRSNQYQSGKPVCELLL